MLWCAMVTRQPPAKVATPLSVEDDERHGDQVDGYIARNRDALNASISKSRKELADGKVSAKSIDDIIAEGRRKHGKG